jgi:hypothetical protein
MFANISVRVTVLPRWSVANGIGSNRSALPFLASGHAAAGLLAMSLSPTHKIRRPSWWFGSGSGHTHPSGRRSAEASAERFSMMSLAVTPSGRSMSQRQPGPSRVIGAGNPIPRPVFTALFSSELFSDPSALITAFEVSSGTTSEVTARPNSGASAVPPRTPSQDAAPTASRTATPTGAANTTAAIPARTGTPATAVIIRRALCRSAVRWASFMCSTASALRTASRRSGAVSASRTHRDQSASTRAPPRGTRTAIRPAYSGTRTAWYFALCLAICFA